MKTLSFALRIKEFADFATPFPKNWFFLMNHIKNAICPKKGNHRPARNPKYRFRLLVHSESGPFWRRQTP
jgi:hypothetical protein